MSLLAHVPAHGWVARCCCAHGAAQAREKTLRAIALIAASDKDVAALVCSYVLDNDAHKTSDADGRRTYARLFALEVCGSQRAHNGCLRAYLHEQPHCILRCAVAVG